MTLARCTRPPARSYPSQLAPLLYLGDWSHAEAVERHAELGIKAVSPLCLMAAIGFRASAAPWMQGLAGQAGPGADGPSKDAAGLQQAR